jgi:hypothetical protein
MVHHFRALQYNLIGPSVDSFVHGLLPGDFLVYWGRDGLFRVSFGGIEG